MVLAIHIITALLSILVAFFSILLPSNKNHRMMKYFTASALFTGFGVLVTNPDFLGRGCLSGLVFLGFTALASRVVKAKLALNSSS